MTITDRDASIYAQVAFKAAVDATEGDLLTTAGQEEFDGKFAVLTTKLFEGIAQSISDHVTVSNPAPRERPAAYDVEAGLASELGASYAEPEVVGGDKQGPFPAWALKRFAADGVRKVYDNRAQLAEKPTRPHFKDADSGTGYWPAKKG